MKVSMFGSSIWLGWMGRVGGVGVSPGKVRASGMVSVNEEGVELIVSEEAFSCWFGWGSVRIVSVVGGYIGSNGCSVVTVGCST